MLRNRTNALEFAVLSFLTFYLYITACLSAQVTVSSSKRNGDVIVLSLASLHDSEADHRKHIREKLTANPSHGDDLDKQLFDVQMEILHATAGFGPVLLIAPDEMTKNAIYQNCKYLQICDLFKSGDVRMKVVPHEGVWIRDFGPQIEEINGTAHVAHWRYFDNRTEQSKREAVDKLDGFLAKLIETRLQPEDQDEFSEESTAESRSRATADLDARINLVREYIQTLKERSVQRSADEDSAFDVADAVLAAPGFSYKRSQISVDGGNLLKLGDSRCLTTRVLLSRNKDQQFDVNRELKEVGGCKDVIFLDPLPGPVIEHADMFVLPVNSNRLLLASYDLSKAYASTHWAELSEAERYLAINAALAMDRNAERLKKLGYEVIPVPSPFPRIPKDGDTYYPTILNALVRSNTDGKTQVLVPSYKGYEEDVQAAGIKTIEDAFGANAQVITIEATSAAKAQGAVHCLTITVPLDLSIFLDNKEEKRRLYYLSLKDQLDHAHVEEITAQIPSTGVQGLWAMLEEDEQLSPSDIESSPKKLYFGEQDFQVGILDRLLLKGEYEIDKREGDSWSMRIRFPDQDARIATLHWLGKDSMKFSFEDDDTIWLLKHLDLVSAEPFRTDDVVDRAVPPSAASGVTHIRHHRKHIAKKAMGNIQ